MKRKHFRIRFRLWLALAVAIASLGLTSSAFARPYLDDSYDASTAPQVPAAIVTTNDGFNWSDAAVGAGVALGAAFCCIGVAYVARHRTHLAT